MRKAHKSAHKNSHRNCRVEYKIRTTRLGLLYITHHFKSTSPQKPRCESSKFNTRTEALRSKLLLFFFAKRASRCSRAAKCFSRVFAVGLFKKAPLGKNNVVVRLHMRLGRISSVILLRHTTHNTVASSKSFHLLLYLVFIVIIIRILATTTNQTKQF